MINAEEKQKIKDDVRTCFIERIENTISEKISDCIKKGFTEDEANYTIIQIVKNLSDNLLPIRYTSKEVCDEEMLLAGHCNTSSAKFPEWPPNDDVNDGD